MDGPPLFDRVFLIIRSLCFWPLTCRPGSIWNVSDALEKATKQTLDSSIAESSSSSLLEDGVIMNTTWPASRPFDACTVLRIGILGVAVQELQNLEEVAPDRDQTPYARCRGNLNPCHRVCINPTNFFRIRTSIAGMGSNETFPPLQKGIFRDPRLQVIRENPTDPGTCSLKSLSNAQLMRSVGIPKPGRRIKHLGTSLKSARAGMFASE